MVCDNLTTCKGIGNIKISLKNHYITKNCPLNENGKDRSVGTSVEDSEREEDDEMDEEDKTEGEDDTEGKDGTDFSIEKQHIKSKRVDQESLESESSSGTEVISNPSKVKALRAE